MDEDIVQATSALSLSPSKNASGYWQAFASGPVVHNKGNGALAPLCHRANHLPLSTNVVNLPRPTHSSASSASTPAMPSRKYSKTSTGSKRSRTQSEDAGVNVSNEDAQSPTKLARHGSKPVRKASESIVISDDEVDGAAERPSVAELATDSSSPPNLKVFADLYTYESPQKTRLSKADRSSLKAQVLWSGLDSGQLSVTSACSTVLTDVAEEDLTVPASANGSLLVSKNKTKVTKAGRTAFVQLKKTRQLAEQASISPLDLSAIPAAGFRLLGRCPFCAVNFTKSAAAKAKQEHMSLCAPLNGIKSNTTAAESVISDIRSMQRRNEKEEKRIRDERTVFQEMVQEAHIVRHEGRASQIEASPKKRGRDTVLIKKSVKRSANKTLFPSDEDENSYASIPRYVKHNLLPASNTRLVARGIADQLLGGTISDGIPAGKTEGLCERQARSRIGDSSAAAPRAEQPCTPDKRKTQSSRLYDSGASPKFDGGCCETNTLPYFSAEEMFASLSTTSSPQKSPFKALQKSRERQHSREQELSHASQRSHADTQSPSLPRTQPFSTSKLAERRRAADGKQRPILFGAETTTRSLLDLVSDQRKAEVSENSNEPKRKAADIDLPAQSGRAKRCRTVADETHDADVKHRLATSSSPFIAQLRFSETAADVGASCQGVSDMDVENPSIDAVALPLQEHVSSGCQITQIQGQHSGTMSNGSALSSNATGPIDLKASIPLQQDSGESSSDFLQISDAGDIDISVDHDLDSNEEDDDEDTQSFLELLEPLEPSQSIAIASYTSSLCETSQEELDGSDETQSASLPPPSDHQKSRSVLSFPQTLEHSGIDSASTDKSPHLTDLSSP